MTTRKPGPKTNRRHLLQFLCTSADVKRVRLAARASDRSVSAWLRWVVEQHLTAARS